MKNFTPISVSERLPDNDKMCLLYCRGGAYDQLRWNDLGYYSGGKWYMTCAIDECENERVTHWLPVPELPEENT